MEIEWCYVEMVVDRLIEGGDLSVYLLKCENITNPKQTIKDKCFKQTTKIKK